MARRTVITLTDDLDGGEAQENVQFALDGVNYEIDLNTANAYKLREFLEPYKAASRRQGAGRRTIPTSQRHALGTPRKDIPEVREWAFAQGLNIAVRGRIPADIVEAYDNRNNSLRGPALIAEVHAKHDAAPEPKSEPAEPQSALPEITEKDREYAADHYRTVSKAGIERLIHASSHNGDFPDSGGSITTNAVNTLIRHGFGIEGEGNIHRVNGAGLAVLQLHERKLEEKAAKVKA